MLVCTGSATGSWGKLLPDYGVQGFSYGILGEAASRLWCAGVQLRDLGVCLPLTRAQVYYSHALAFTVSDAHPLLTQWFHVSTLFLLFYLAVSVWAL